MNRPSFTDSEEKLIEYIRNHEPSAQQVWFWYLPWLIGSILLFGLGLHFEQAWCETSGYLVALGFLMRFIYFQCKPDWNIKPIVDKYEEALRHTESDTP